MNILVFKQRDVEKFTCDRPWACISISHGTFPEISDTNRVGLLQLKFHDIDDKRYDFEYDPADVWGKNYKLFTTGHAEQILDFYREIEDKCKVLVIHCLAGLSRSPAVAAALTRCFIQDDDAFWFNRYTPNMKVYRTILETYNENHRKS